MANETKNVLETLFKNFNTIIRHMFSGLVAVFLFEIGNSGVDVYADIRVVSDMNRSQGVCYAVVAFVVGNLIYFLMRYVICAAYMRRLHKKKPSLYGRGLTTNTSTNYIEEIGNFAQYRWSEDFSPKLDEYLIYAWGWVHGLGSVAIVFIGIPWYFRNQGDKLFSGSFGWSCIVAGVILFLSYLWHIRQLLSMENIAYKERGNARCTLILQRNMGSRNLVVYADNSL